MRDLGDRTARLQRHVRQILTRSLTQSVMDAPARGSLNVTQFYTHESAAWPKPQRCQDRRAAVCQHNPHFCLLLPQGNSPRSSLISELHGIEFRQVWKVASSSLASFFYCNMWGNLRAEKIAPGQPLPAHAKHLHVVFPSREPIGRFVASCFEVLERLLNRVSPGGQRIPDEMYVEPKGPLSSSMLYRTTSWYGPLRSLLNATGARERQMGILATLNGFIEDIECGIVYSAAEHLATQMTFLTSGNNARTHLDFQIRLSNVATDLETLAGFIKYHPVGNTSAWKCPLGRENDVASKARLPISKDDFVAALAKHPSLIRRLCTVYIQDFLCLGYVLPPECEGGGELIPWAASSGRLRHAEQPRNPSQRATVWNPAEVAQVKKS